MSETVRRFSMFLLNWSHWVFLWADQALTNSFLLYQGFSEFSFSIKLSVRALLKRNFKGNPITILFRVVTVRFPLSDYIYTNVYWWDSNSQRLTFLKYSKLSILKIDNSLYPPKVQIAYASYSTPYSRISHHMFYKRAFT